jgi:hypothetical protein
MSADHFPLSVCFPDAAAIFNRRHKNFDEIKGDCLVALDTNVLLAPYSLSDKDIAQIETVYQSLSQAGRLMIPAQVAREFARHRSTKLGDLVKTLQDQMSRTGSPLSTKFSFLKLVPEYANALKLSEEVEQKEKELARTLRAVLEKVRSWESNDPIWELYRKYFGSFVTELNAGDEKNLPDELKFRNLHSIPPGYKDEKKADGGSGDLIIWKTILQEGKKRQANIIFVTIDQKPDWWTQSASSPLYPRFELLEEFGAVTGGKSVMLMRFSDFLEKFGAEETVVKEVKRVEDQAAVAADPEEEFPRRIISNRTRLVLHSELRDMTRLERALNKEIMSVQDRIIRAREENAPGGLIETYKKELEALKTRQQGVRRRIVTLRERTGSENLF